MTLADIFQLIKNKWQTVLAFMLGLTVLALIFSLVQPQKYGADQRFLIVQTLATDVDPYAAIQSTQSLAGLFSDVMGSQSFMDQVFADKAYPVDRNAFPSDPTALQKAWQKTVRPLVSTTSGILEVTVYDTDRNQAEQLSLAIGDVLRTKNAQYHGRGRNVNVQTIDAPIVSNYPVQPNILINVGIGAVLGLIAGLCFVYLFPTIEFAFGDLVRVFQRPLNPQELSVQRGSLPSFGQALASNDDDDDDL